MEARKIVLIGDVGGTNVRLQIFKISNDYKQYDSRNAVKSKTYKAVEFQSFDKFVEDFVTQVLTPEEYPQFAVIGIAGAIHQNKTKLANTTWPEVDGNEIGEALQIKPFILYNDFHTLSYGVLGLDEKRLFALVAPSVLSENSVKVVCGPGTGLGVSMIIPLGGNNYQVWPTEGGHCNFAPSSPLSFQYLVYLMEQLKTDQVHLEHATAGPGIPYMYNFIKSVNSDIIPKLEQLQPDYKYDLSDPRVFPSQLVMAAGLKGEDEICKLTLEFFIELYEASIGDIIVRQLPFGGIYLFGGLTISLLEYLQQRVNNKLFMQNYKKERPYFDHVFQRVPIYIILSSDLGLEGAYVNQKNQKFFKETSYKVLYRSLGQI